ncbi:MAG: helix-turn-helix transcriptional regulator [Lawsonibacter sp.]|jgi:transcriptional regulator with XRE-family HTH domain|nr:helix-turn-helix transcriptional regulator [Lawsonibacter sp.]
MFHKDLYGLRLKKLRNQAGEKQTDLAELLGVKPNQIVEMENGRKTTTFEKLTIICQHYNVSADYLLGLIDEPRPLS